MEFTLELTDQKKVKAFADFLNTISGESAPAEQTAAAPPVKEDAKSEEDVLSKAPAKRASRAKNQEAKAPEAASNVEEKEADAAPSTEDADDIKTAPSVSLDDIKAAPSVSLDDIRSNMSKKVTDHREALQKKLKEFGAKNITTLPEDKYDEFNQFILDL